MLRTFDIFKIPVVLTYKKLPFFSTSFGGCVSLIVIALIISIAVFFSQGIYKRINPLVIIQEETTSEYPAFQINKDNHIIALKFINSDGSWNSSDLNTTKSLFQTVAGWADYTGAFNLFDTDFCHNVYPDYKTMAVNGGELKGAICPKNFNVSIYGNPQAGTNSWFSFFVMQCTNSTYKPITCKSNEEIQRLLGYTYFKIIYLEKILYPENFQNPLKLVTSVYWDFLEYGKLKNIEMYYKVVNIASDIGFMFTNYWNITDVMFDTKMYTKVLTTSFGSTYPLMQVDILMSNKRVYCQRRYDKLQNVLANIGGMIQSLMIIGKIVTLILNKKVMQFDMINSFYDFSQYNMPQEQKKSKDLLSNKLNNNDKNYVAVNDKNMSHTIIKGDVSSSTDRKSGKILELTNLEGQPDSDTNRPNQIEDNVDKLKENEMRNRKEYVLPGRSNIKLNNTKTLNNLDISNLDQKDSKDGKDNKDGKNNQKVEVGLTEIKPKRRRTYSEVYVKERGSPTNIMRKNLIYTPFELIKFAFCPTKCLQGPLQRKAKMLEVGYKQIQDVLDLSSFIKQTHDIGLLKALLLNDVQQQFTEYTEKMKFTDDLLNPDLEKKIKTLCEYYMDKKKNGASQLDEKIFELLDDELKQILEDYIVGKEYLETIPEKARKKKSK